MIRLKYVDDNGVERIDSETDIETILESAPPIRGKEILYFQRNCVIDDNGDIRPITYEEAKSLVEKYQHLLKD